MEAPFGASPFSAQQPQPQLLLQPQFVSQPVLQPKLPPQHHSRIMISRMIQIQQPPLVEQNMVCSFPRAGNLGTPVARKPLNGASEG